MIFVSIDVTHKWLWLERHEKNSRLSRYAKIGIQCHIEEVR